MRKKITVIHTTPATIMTIPDMIYQMYRNVEVVNVLDDSMLNEIKAQGFLTKSVVERFTQYVIIAKNNSSDAVLLACSSIGEAGDIARKVVDIPLYKIDEPMADSAVKSGKSILVLGTVQSTLVPTSNLIQSKTIGTSQTVECKLIPGVFELFATDREMHDRKIAEVVEANQASFDVIVLAQASMSNAIHYVTKKEGILTSLPLGLTQLKTVLG